jgi:site-specific DNA recombinase
MTKESVKNKGDTVLKPDMKGLIVYPYLRVSSSIQVRRESSIPNQLKSVTQYTKRHGWKLGRVFKDEGLTAANDWHKRPELVKLMNAVKRGECNIVMCTRLDRMARDVPSLYEMLKIWDDHNVVFVTSDQNLDTFKGSGFGLFTLGLFALIAKWEHDMISERITEGRQGYIEKHEFSSGNPPFGYKHISIDEWAKIPHDPNEVKPLMVVEVEALAVTYIYTEYTRTGHYIGYDKLAIKMNNETTYPPPDPTRGGKKRFFWTGDRLEGILINPIYKGGWGTPGWRKGDYWFAAKPIVTRELWDLAQSTRKNNPERPRSGVLKSKYQGHLYCSLCGCRLYPDTNHGKHLVWACKGSLPRTHGGDKSKLCKFPRLDLKEIDARIDVFINGMMTNPTKLKENLEKALTELKNDFKNESADTSLISDQIAQVDNQIGIAFVNSEEGMYTPEVYKDKIRKLKADKIKLEKRRQRLDPDADTDAIQKQITIKYIQDMIDKLSKMKPKEIKRYIKSIAIQNILNNFKFQTLTHEDNQFLKYEDRTHDPWVKSKFMEISAEGNFISLILDTEGKLRDSVTFTVFPDKTVRLRLEGKTMTDADARMPFPPEIENVCAL